MGTILPEALVSARSRRAAFLLLDDLVETGATALDLAASYMLGGTERLIGAWLRERQHRERLFLVTKGAHPYPLISPNRLTPRAIAEDLDGSLRRLGIEQIDLYLLHRDHPDAHLEDLVATLSIQQRAGKFRAFGVSNWHHDRITQLDVLAHAAGLPSVRASSPHFSLAEWTRVPWKGSVSIAGSQQDQARAFYTRAQLPVLAYSPLGRGYFSGPTSPTGDVYDSQTNTQRKARAQQLADERGVSTEEVALAYLFCQPFPTYAVVATSSATHLRCNLAAATQQLTQKELHWLESGEAS